LNLPALEREGGGGGMEEEAMGTPVPPIGPGRILLVGTVEEES
jgi:hypothetical protein